MSLPVSLPRKGLADLVDAGEACRKQALHCPVRAMFAGRGSARRVAGARSPKSVAVSGSRWWSTNRFVREERRFDFEKVSRGEERANGREHFARRRRISSDGMARMGVGGTGVRKDASVGDADLTGVFGTPVPPAEISTACFGPFLSEDSVSSVAKTEVVRSIRPDCTLASAATLRKLVAHSFAYSPLRCRS